MKPMNELDENYCSILSSAFLIEHQIESTIRKIIAALY